jgi:hypothetical protein
MSSRIIVEALLLVTWWGVRDYPSRVHARRAARRASARPRSGITPTTP